LIALEEIETGFLLRERKGKAFQSPENKVVMFAELALPIDNQIEQLFD
jgi:hypothetical protein